MHIAMVIGGGLLLLCVFLLFGRLWDVALPGPTAAAWAFLPVWALVALANCWVGVARAGYSLREELPILALVFLAPAALAGAVIWRLAR